MERDDIPAIDIIEAAARKEREETEELLAGFDRPGREPRKARKKDFVAHFAGEKTAPPPAEERVDTARKKATFVVPREREVPLWLPWVGLAALMILFGGLVAFLATGEPTPTATKPTPTSVTTITSAPKATTTMRTEDIPPPPPSTATANATEEAAPSQPPVRTSPPSTPRPRPRDPAAAPNGSSPREDFIRDL
jgi:hypothetical protein